MKLRRGLATALAGVGLVVLSCSADRGSLPPSAGADASTSTINVEAPVESPAAATRIAELRARFHLAVRAPDEGVAGLARGARAKAEVPTMRAALGEAVATRFEAAAGPDAATHLRAVLPPEALRGVARAAHVALPVRANGEVKLEDETSHVSVRFALETVQNARVEVAGGMALYRGALAGADVVHRVHAEGTEDFVVFETRPAREELSYSVDVSRVPGLRLVSNTLEFLDDTGTPLLRVAPPYVVDAVGRRHEAKVAVSGCAYDTSPVGPWGRSLTKRGADRCTVRIAWGGVAYPAIVDPAWGATGSMATTRHSHTASVLPTGKVLVAGGCSGQNCASIVASAELYDPAGNGGAGTFAATGSMSSARVIHTASVLASGSVLIAGGLEPVLGAPTSSAEIFEPGSGTFRATGAMGNARQYHGASVLLSGKVLVAGGCNGQGGCSTPLASAELYDPTGNGGVGNFAVAGTLNTARRGHTSTVLPSGKVLLAGGIGSGNAALTSAELYDPAGLPPALTLTGPLSVARAFHTATVLPSDKVLVAGGSSNNVPLSSAELFDPAIGAGHGGFVAIGAMLTARFLHTASLLPTGNVLIAGGSAGAELASAEVFDLVANSFAMTVPMAVGRRAPTASVLPSGKILVAGGLSNGLTQALASAELFGGTQGDRCTVNGMCQSGFCADGYCCDTLCSNACDRCDLPNHVGTCTPAPDGNPGAPACALPFACDGVNAACPTSCASDAACAAAYYCSADGSCQPRKAQASACNVQADCKLPGCRECTSGFCADGFCCDKACNGSCEACGAAVKQSGVADGTCDAAKEGLVRGGVLCGPGATCDGDHTTKSADGTTKDCAPYKCDSNGTCQGLCKSVNDCVAPTICDATGKCVAASDTAGDSGGCSVSRFTHAQRCDSSPLALAIVGALAAFARRRRRRGLATRTAAVSGPLGARSARSSVLREGRREDVELVDREVPRAPPSALRAPRTGAPPRVNRS